MTTQYNYIINNFFNYFNNSRNELFIIALIFLINISFKLINLTHEPIWYDECFSIFYSQGSIDEILNVSKWDINPPFFNLFLHTWVKLFGTSELTMRLVPAILSSLTGVVLFLFLKKYAGFRAAITGSVLYLFSNISFIYAQEVRGYSLILLISLLSIWLFIRMMEKPTYAISILLGGTYYILIMTHYLTFFILLAQGILFLIFFSKVLLKYYLIAVGAFVLFFLHWLPRVIEIISGGSKHWLQSPNLGDLSAFISNISNGTLQLLILLTLAGIAIAAVTAKKESLLPNRAIKAIFIYSILISFASVLLNYIISSTIPIFLDRYLLFSLTGFILFYSICISRLPLSNIYYYCLLTLIGSYAYSQMYINGPTRKMDYRSAVNYVKYEQDSSSFVFIQTIDVTALFTYYYDKEIFKNYSNIENLLKEKNVFTGNDSTKIASFNDSIYTKVIHVETFCDNADPNKTVISFFNKRGYVLVKTKDDLVGVKITTFQKR